MSRRAHRPSPRAAPAEAGTAAAPESEVPLVPSRRQYLELKVQHPGAILLYRLGDFYETFDDDAAVVARDARITLTSRSFGRSGRVPMAGIPHHALNGYLGRLLAAGHAVAIAEQVSPAGHGLVERRVTRVLTPGTVADPALLPAAESRYLAALFPHGDRLGLAWVDVSTGEFATLELSGTDRAARLRDELARLLPAETLLPDDRVDDPVADALSGHRTPFERRFFEPERAGTTLCERFGVRSLAAYGCADRPAATGAAGAIVAFVERTNPTLVPLLTGLRTEAPGRGVGLDAATRRNLELSRSFGTGGSRGSLLGVLDLTRTAMGARALRRLIGQPLRDLVELRRRQAFVAALVGRPSARAGLGQALSATGDLERLAGRIVGRSAGVRDALALAAALDGLPRIAAELARLGSTAAVDLRTAADGPNTANGGDPGADLGAAVDGHRGPDFGSGPVYDDPDPNPGSGPHDSLTPGADPRTSSGNGTPFGHALDPCADVAALLASAVEAGPDGTPRIRAGFAPELDAAVAGARETRRWLARLEGTERARTGIKSLKVGFNKVFGYYIEVTRPNLAAVPPEYSRKQTVATGERFVTAPLKDAEARLLAADEEIAALEQQALDRIADAVTACVGRLLATAATLAEVDAFLALAEVAARNGWVAPELSEGDDLEIEGGRHPVVEASLGGEPFIPNDCRLGGECPRQLLVTGPNMGGKSTFLRQVALVVLLAQVGSFVPARRARIGLVDRIFSRVGAQDDLARGQSTFMVEMVETAAILHQATRRSLLILDEVGRGTATDDGLAIARATLEDIALRIGARCLFATHYLELTTLAADLPSIANAHVAVLETGGRVVFLYAVRPGPADRAYGVQVARLAGLPPWVADRAEGLLADLTNGAGRPVANPDPTGDARGDAQDPPAANGRLVAEDGSAPYQLLLDGFVAGTSGERLLRALRELDLDAMTPREALDWLWEERGRLG